MMCRSCYHSNQCAYVYVQYRYTVKNLDNSLYCVHVAFYLSTPR